MRSKQFMYAKPSYIVILRAGHSLIKCSCKKYVWCLKCINLCWDNFEVDFSDIISLHFLTWSKVWYVLRRCNKATKSLASFWILLYLFTWKNPIEVMKSFAVLDCLKKKERNKVQKLLWILCFYLYMCYEAEHLMPSCSCQAPPGTARRRKRSESRRQFADSTSARPAPRGFGSKNWNFLKVVNTQQY